MKPRARLQWDQKELEELRARVSYLEGIIATRDETMDSVDELIGHLKGCIQDAPCLVARPGESTYECRAGSLCRVCQWRRGVSQDLIDEWHLPNGIW